MAHVFTTRKFCAGYTQRPSTPYQTRKNVKTCLKNVSNERRFLQNHFFSYKFSHEPQDLWHQNRCLVWWSVLRVPRNILREVSKMRHLQRETWLIGWKRRKSIALVRQNDFRYAVKHVGMSQTTTPATPTEATGHSKFLKVTTFRPYRALTRTVVNSCERLRTVADGCGRRCNVQRTHPEPPAQTPGVKREPLLHIRQEWCCRDTFSERNVVKLNSSGQGPGLKGTSPRHWMTIKKWEPKSIFSMRCGSYMIYDLREVRDW